MKTDSKRIALWSIVPAIAAAMMLLIYASCATTQHAYHAYIMRGSVVEAAGGGIYVCIGTHDGAKVGQELDVHRIDVIGSGNPKVPPKFKRRHVGRVRIAEIVDEHFANASIVSGEAMKNDIVELEMK
jgi:drug/metabolite transporter superfamily protein YnfA